MKGKLGLSLKQTTKKDNKPVKKSLDAYNLGVSQKSVDYMM